MGLKIIQETDALTHVALSGRLDTIGVDEIERSFLAHTASRKKPTIVDLSKVAFIASMGMRMLIHCVNTLHPAGVKMVLLNPQAMTKNALNVAGVTKLIPVAHDFIQAMALLVNG